MVLHKTDSSSSIVSNNMKDGALSKASEKATLKHKRRYCKVEGCCRIVKSQGVCQRHGAKPRKCRIVECRKQAQGNYNGMCKAHFRSTQQGSLSSISSKEERQTSTTPIPFVCKPVYIPPPTVVADVSIDRRQGPGGEESTISAVSDEDAQGRDLWDEPLSFYGSNAQSEELAADLFNILPEGNSSSSSSMTCEEWCDGRIARREEVAATGNRVLSVDSIPSCSDYSHAPALAAPSRQWGTRHVGHHSGGYMDYYIHHNTSAREAV